MITPEQVQTAILVLKAYIAEQDMDISDTLMAELTDTIDLAAYGPIICEVDPPKIIRPPTS